MTRTSPLLSLGWFRSGTTYLFNCLKEALPDRLHFYEPFNPNISRYLKEYRQIKAQHPYKEIKLRVKKGRNDFLFQPYFERGNFVGKRFREAFGLKNFFLDENSDYPELERYIRGLNRCPQAVHFQMNRSLGRIGLLKKLFPEISVIILVRHPGAVWASMQGYPEDLLDPLLDPGKFQLNRLLGEFSRLPQAQLPEFQDRLKKIDSLPPFEQFLLVWTALHRVAETALQTIPRTIWLRYEDLVLKQSESLKLISDKLAINIVPEKLPRPRTAALDRWKRLKNAGGIQQLFNTLPAPGTTRKLLKKFSYLAPQQRPGS